jgi:hypothetical protein
MSTVLGVKLITASVSNKYTFGDSIIQFEAFEENKPEVSRKMMDNYVDAGTGPLLMVGGPVD